MNRLRAFSRSYRAFLFMALLAGMAALFLSFVLFFDRKLCEPVLPYLVPIVTKALFRSPLYYRPEQYYWIAGYIGALSAVWTVGMMVAIMRQPAEDARIDAALMRKLGRQRAHGAPLEP